MVLLQLLSIHDRAVGVTNLGVMLLCAESYIASVIHDLENFAVLKIFQWHLKMTKLICHPWLSLISKNLWRRCHGKHIASIQLGFSRALGSAT